jgi:hypothetical protein
MRFKKGAVVKWNLHITIFICCLAFRNEFRKVKIVKYNLGQVVHEFGAKRALSSVVFRELIWVPTWYPNERPSGPQMEPVWRHNCDPNGPFCLSEGVAF